jgi:hypothetical protein
MLTFFLYPAKSSLTCFAASTFAGLSVFGMSEESKLMTERSCWVQGWHVRRAVREMLQRERLTIDSTLWTGNHLSPASS